MTLLDTHQRPDAGTVLELEPLGPSFGVIVHGVDVPTATDEQVAALRQALVDHKVVFLREQRLTDDDQVELGRRLGELTAAHPVVGGVDAEHPEVYNIDSDDPDFMFSDVWHTDVTFMPNPPLGSILRAVQLPPSGGDTMWADAQLAYESLSGPVRRAADELVAVHDGTRAWSHHLKHRRRGEGNEWDGEVVRELRPVEHPVVRVHPESGRKGLFVNPGFTSHLIDVSEAESRHLLDVFYAHLTQPEHVVRHRWREGDVGLWDNRSTLHYAARNYDATRIMHRITIRGDRPVGPARG